MEQRGDEDIVVKRGWVLDPEKISFRPKNIEIPLVLYKHNLLLSYNFMFNIYLFSLVGKSYSEPDALNVGIEVEPK